MAWFARSPARPAAAAPSRAGSRLQRSTAAAAICCTLVGGFEGLRTTAYPDPATGREPWTVCYGETEGVRRGDTYTLAQCRAMLAGSLEKYALAVERCAVRPMRDEAFAAHVSLAYNIGTGAYCKSTAARLWAAGDVRGACDAFLRWNRAGGVVFPGLTRRRAQERTLCLKGA